MRRIKHIPIFTLLFLFIGTRSIFAENEERPEVRDVTFEGNRAFDESTLQTLMATQSSGFLSSSYFYAAILADDLDNIINLYHQKGYLEATIVDAQVTLDTVDSSVDVHVVLEEGELTQVEGVSLFGNSVFEDSVLLDLIGLRPGDSLEREKINSGMLSIVALYADSGYLDAAVKPEIRINSETHRGLIDLTVIERNRSMISEIRIDSLTKTNTNVVTRELLFQQGDKVRHWQLLESQRLLYLTRLFESVFVRPEATAGHDSTGKTIIIELKEKLSSEFNVGVGYGSVEKLKGRIELLTNNLAGNARQLGTTVYADFIKRGLEASFSEPRTFETRWKTDISLFLEFLEQPSYDLSRYGGRLTVGRSLGRNATISFAYRHENANLKHVETTDVPENIHPRVRSVIISITQDTRDNLFNPMEGTYLEWTNELAGSLLRGTNTFARSIIRFKKFYPLNSETVFGTAAELGWMFFFGSSRDISLNERFFAGGPNSIRGFGYQLVGPLDDNGNPRGGQFKIVWNMFEIRRTLYKMIGVVGFADIGNVWLRAGEFRLGELRTSIGAGLRANTPIGIVRLDFGINVNPKEREPGSRLYFSMGQAF